MWALHSDLEIDQKSLTGRTLLPLPACFTGLCGREILPEEALPRGRIRYNSPRNWQMEKVGQDGCLGTMTVRKAVAGQSRMIASELGLNLGGGQRP